METLRYEVRDGVGLLTLCRPKALNALNAKLVGELDQFLGELAAGSPVPALVLTGDGLRAFAAGADIKEMAGMSEEEALRWSAQGQRVCAMLEELPAVTIAAVNGFALGGGCELALACDLVLAGPNAVFGQPEVKLGVIPGFGGTVRLARRVGRQRALEIMATARNVPAAEAVAIGLALRVVDDGDVVQAALALGKQIAGQGPEAVRLLKRAVHEASGEGPAFHAERALFARCFTTSDQKEGMAAFVERRAAVFTGR